jgi:hypothetical protein
LSSEFSGVPEDSKFPLLGVWASPSHLAQSGVATINKPMKQPNNIAMISKRGICQLNNFGILEVL